MALSRSCGERKTLSKFGFFFIGEVAWPQLALRSKTLLGPIKGPYIATLKPKKLYFFSLSVLFGKAGANVTNIYIPATQTRIKIFPLAANKHDIYKPTRGRPRQRRALHSRRNQIRLRWEFPRMRRDDSSATQQQP